MIEWLNEKELHDFEFLAVDYEIGDIVKFSKNDTPLKFKGTHLDPYGDTMYFYTETNQKSQYLKMTKEECEKYNVPIESIGFYEKGKAFIIKKAKTV